MKSVFGQIVMRTDEARRAFETHPVLMDAVAHGLAVERYRALLLELYAVVWHFNPVCAAAASRVPDSMREQRYFLYAHMHEESGHEIWVRNDLEALDIDAAATAAHKPGPYTQALCGFNYFAADRGHPASVFGMMYALEVIASVYGGPFSSAIRERLLLDGEIGISFIASHATMDAQHMAELRTILSPINDAAAVDAIVDSAVLNFHHFTHIVGSV